MANASERTKQTPELTTKATALTNVPQYPAETDEGNCVQNLLKLPEHTGQQMCNEKATAA